MSGRPAYQRGLGAFLNMLTGSDPWHCEFHDRPSEAKIARLEVETGIDPLAEQRRWPQRQYTQDGRPLPLIIPRMDDPDLIDCGSSRCRKRRGLS